MSNPQCPNHGEMKWKEGFAKATGKPYAFWTCPTKMPDGSWCPTKGPKGAPGASQAPSAPQAPSAASGEVVELLTRIAVALERISNRDLDSIPFGN